MKVETEAAGHVGGETVRAAALGGGTLGYGSLVVMACADGVCSLALDVVHMALEMGFGG